MKTVEHYHRYAGECRQLAKGVSERLVRDALIKAAEMWERLAESRNAEHHNGAEELPRTSLDPVEPGMNRGDE